MIDRNGDQHGGGGYGVSSVIVVAVVVALFIYGKRGGEEVEEADELGGDGDEGRR